MDMIRITARWTGFPGGPGYSNFFFAGGGGLISDAQQCVERVRDAFTEVAGALAANVVINIEPEVSIIDSDTGITSDFVNVEPGTPILSAGVGSYSGPTGAVINWRTNDLRGGRRIRGRTFLVPLANTAFADDGTLNSGAMLVLNNFANELRGVDFDSELGVWSRPVGGAGGVFATVVNHTIPDMAAVLRSRRD